MQVRSLLKNEKTFEIVLPNPRACMQISNRLGILLGPAIGTLKSQTDRGGMEAFGSAIGGIDPDSIDEIFMSAVRSSNLSVEKELINTDMTFNKYFDENRSEVYPVCIWCLWECVKDFFPQLGGFVQTAKTMAEKAFKSPPDGK